MGERIYRGQMAGPGRQRQFEASPPMEWRDRPVDPQQPRLALGVNHCTVPKFLPSNPTSRRQACSLLNLHNVCRPVYEQWASFYGLAHGGAGRRESSTEAFDSSKHCRPLDWLRSHVEPESRWSSELLIQAREIRFVDFRARPKLGFRVVEVQVEE